MITEAERVSVFEAYAQAFARGEGTPICYSEAITALRRLHPELPRERAATEAVRIIFMRDEQW
jgi:hypothetical protein